MTICTRKLCICPKIKIEMGNLAQLLEFYKERQIDVDVLDKVINRLQELREFGDICDRKMED